jgi:arylsulfatase A-like enzyme
MLRQILIFGVLTDHPRGNGFCMERFAVSNSIAACRTGNQVARLLVRSLLLILICCTGCGVSRAPVPETSTQTPNILFIIMDDVGIDQLRTFGYGGVTPPSTPNLDAIVHAGVTFRNVWAMPECSPSRAIFFEGRYPLRTNVYSAILSDDLANSQVSPYEFTTPEVLRNAGYISAMFGKFHLAGPDNNPYSFGTPSALGWDYFDGFLAGAPPSIDTTVGGQFPSGTYTCGFVPNADAGGADSGACYAPDLSCTDLKRDATHSTPGRTCMESGGIMAPKQSCAQPPPTLNFLVGNGYYAANRVINQTDGTAVQLQLNDPAARGYVLETTNKSAISWINTQDNLKKPWMATVSYATIHTPYQQPPSSLLPATEADTSGLQCTGNDTRNEAATRILSNQMLEAMDTEIGNLLVQTGLATFNGDGSLNYHPENTNTTVIVIGDNGTFAPGVKAPFDPNRAKGYVYQTGVWVPLIIAGPQVVAPGRTVTAMVNAADLFQLFGEIAGLDVRKIVPPSHMLDSVSMLPYLTNPSQTSLRQSNFTQTGNNIHPVTPGPCVIQLTSPPTCAQLFTGASLCNAEGGVWYGSGATQQFSSCCAISSAHLSQYPDGIQILPDFQTATRNEVYKLVQLQVPDCSTNGQDEPVTEFYSINEDLQNPQLDKSGDSLCASTGCPDGLSGDALNNFNQLLAAQQATLASEPACPGDGNEDKLVSQLDIQDWQLMVTLGAGTSSWYDLNLDGVTDNQDLKIIQQNMGNNCQHSNAPPP